MLLLAMIALLDVGSGDWLIYGPAALGVCLIVYLFLLEFREKRLRRKEEQELQRQRLAHSGHE